MADETPRSRSAALDRLRANNGDAAAFRTPTTAELAAFIEFAAADFPLGAAYRYAVDLAIPDHLARAAGSMLIRDREIGRRITDTALAMEDGRREMLQARLSEEGTLAWLARLAEQSEEAGMFDKAATAVRDIARIKGYLDRKGDGDATVRVVISREDADL